MIGYESFVETTGAQASSSSPHAMPPLLSGVGGAVSGTPIA
jgi:hypothetical protein